MTTIVESDDSSVEEGLTDVARAAIWSAWERANGSKLSRFESYRHGRSGIPDVREGASDEIKELAKQSVRNVCGVTVDTFVRGLSVVGFRSPTADDNEPAWEWWQRQRLDARQSEVHDAACTYGWSFVSVLPDGVGEPVAATWSPRNVDAVFDDRRRDLFPRFATLMREVNHEMFGKGTSVLWVDDTWVQAGFIPKARDDQKLTVSKVVLDGEPYEHGATYMGEPVCPVVPFWNERSAEDRDPRGEVEPLIQPQRAINTVNFNRLCISQFSAFRQKVVIGWTPSDGDVARASAANVWTFEDHPSDVRVEQLDASPLAPYDNLLREMTEQVALVAGLPMHQLTGSLQNVSTETAALAESAHQRKLQLKRESFGESWEQVIRLAVEMLGLETPDDSAEVLWRETEARSFAAVVDGIVKLAQEDVPIEELLDLIPGMTQQRAFALRQAITRRRSSNVLAALAEMGANAQTPLEIESA